MEIILSIILFIVSIFVLIKSSDFFVESAAKIAKLFGVSNFVIGMSVVAIGTSLPELLTSVFAAGLGNTELVIGNIVGSNIANIGLIVGLGAVLVALGTSQRMQTYDSLILAFVTFIFFFFCIDGIISRTEGLILLILFALYLIYIFKLEPFTKKEEKQIEKGAFFLTKINKAHLKELGIAAVSLIFLIYSAKLVVTSATGIAEFLGVPSNIIAVTLIALGTSLPELSVAFSSLKKGMKDLLIGNILGSNITNVLLIGGVASLIRPIGINFYSIFFTIPVMVVLTSLIILFMRTQKQIVKWEGAVLLGIYVLFMAGVWIASI